MKLLILILSILIYPTFSLTGQFINIQINIEPELSTSVERELEFGDLVTNSGQSFVNLGDVNMGVFNIRALRTQRIYIELLAPEFLSHSNPAVPDIIPIELFVAYNNTGIDNPLDSNELTNNAGFLPITDINQDLNESDVWKQLYVYVYGSVTINNINTGEYSSEIALIVDYE